MRSGRGRPSWCDHSIRRSPHLDCVASKSASASPARDGSNASTLLTSPVTPPSTGGTRSARPINEGPNVVSPPEILRSHFNSPPPSFGQRLLILFAENLVWELEIASDQIRWTPPIAEAMSGLTSFRHVGIFLGAERKIQFQPVNALATMLNRSARWSFRVPQSSKRWKIPINCRRSPTLRSGESDERNEFLRLKHEKHFNDLAGDLLMRLGYK